MAFHPRSRAWHGKTRGFCAAGLGPRRGGCPACHRCAGPSGPWLEPDLSNPRIVGRGGAWWGVETVYAPHISAQIFAFLPQSLSLLGSNKHQHGTLLLCLKNPTRYMQPLPMPRAQGVNMVAMPSNFVSCNPAPGSVKTWFALLPLFPTWSRS